MCLDGILEMHDHVCEGIHLLMGEVDMLSGIVQPVLGLAKAAVRDLQLKVLLCRLTCPTTEEGGLTLQPLHCVGPKGGLFGVRVQMCTLLDDIFARVVLQVESVPSVLGQVGEVEAELQAGDVTHGLVVLLPLGLILILNWEERKWRVGALTQ
jgi:hypothetical protein